MPANTTKHAIPYILGSDIANTIDDTNKTTAERVDVLLTPFDQGALSARPVSSAGSPGKTGRIYRATDGVNLGRTFIDHGTGWTEVGAVLGALLVQGAIALDGIIKPDTQARLRLQGGPAGAGTVEMFNRVSVSDNHAWGAFPDPGAGGLYVRGALKMGPNNDLSASSGVENLRTIRGTVNSNGTIAAGTGFTVTRDSPGNYTVTLTTDFAAAPSVAVAVGNQADTIISTGSSLPGTASFKIRAWNTGTASDADAPFSFIVTGPR